MGSSIVLPGSLDAKSFEKVFEQMARHPYYERVTVDARQCQWCSPYGFATLLSLAQTLRERAVLIPPANPDVVAYWARVGFFRFAQDLYSVQGAVARTQSLGESDVLLEVTPISSIAGINSVIEHIAERVTTILVKKLKYSPLAAMGFTLSLSGLCERIIERSPSGGWVMAQCYQFRKHRDGRMVAVLVVCDGGIGYRRELESLNAHLGHERWSDGAALERAWVEKVSRRKEGVRQPRVNGVRGFVVRHDGKLTVRSGTSRIAFVPKWDDDVPRVDSLAEFPGVQIDMIIPEMMR